ncbi:MAG: hypothetical protein PSN36_01785 [Gammaproteobacteria bacterium]|nr:hypothetical protein [Gammaproteobacteria bacterium]
MKANITIDIKAEFVKDKDGYTAYADVFNAYGMGNTKMEAQKSLKQAIDVYVDEYMRLGVLFDKLQKFGFKKSVIIPKPKKNKTYKKINYDIPLNNYGKERLHA